MNKNRDSLEIVVDMLYIALVKVKKTKIMKEANLNYTQLEKYLEVLLTGGLIQDDGDSYYLITQKGRTFIETYAEYQERFDRIIKEAEETTRFRQLLRDMCFNGKK